MIPLVYLAYNNPYPDKKYVLKGILVLCGLAFFYTTPWDNYILAKGVWWYGPDRILATIGYVPIEEYSFFLIQTVFSGLWTLLVLNLRQRNGHHLTTSEKKILNPQKNLLLYKSGILMILFLVFLYGVYALFHDESFYMGLILAWAMPVVILQFAIGGEHLLKNKTTFLLCALVPTLYLWCIDYYAISDQIWMISEKYTLGYKIGILPIEEMVFFLITNLMVVQGLLLFLILRDTVQVVLTSLKKMKFK